VTKQVIRVIGNFSTPWDSKPKMYQDKRKSKGTEGQTANNSEPTNDVIFYLGEKAIQGI
jgi:hypothetical protein